MNYNKKTVKDVHVKGRMGGEQRLQGGVDRYLHQMPVVQPGPLHRPVADVEAQGLKP